MTTAVLNKPTTEMFNTSAEDVLKGGLSAMTIACETLTKQNEQLVQKAALESGYEQIVAKGKIKSNNSILLKLQLQQQYLEGIFNELSTALQNLKEMIMIDRVTPIAQNITDLLSEVDKIQAESNALAGRVDETEARAQALKDLEDEL